MTKRVAAVVLLLLGAGALNRWVYRSRADAASAYRALCAPLSVLPLQLGRYTYTGDLSLPPETLEVADVDRYVYRQYQGPGPEPPLVLYVGYWGRQNVGMGHGPEVCFPAAGWRRADPATHRILRLGWENGASREAHVALHHFERTEPGGLRRVSVGFAAVLDGRFEASSRGAFAHRPPSSAVEGFLAHIHVTTTPVGGADWAEADERIVDFMGRLLPHVAECLLGEGAAGGGRDARRQIGGA